MTAPAAQPILEPIAVPPATGNVDPATLHIEGDFAFVDTETTGVDAAVDRIIEIAIVRFRGGVMETFHTLIDPQIPIPPTASAVNHITDETIAQAKARGEAPTFEQVADRVAEMLDGATVCAHNAPFDCSFVEGELGLEPLPKEWLCTVRLARHLCPTAPAYGNQVLRYWFKTKPESMGLGAHRAIDDVLVSIENFRHLLSLAQAAGLANLDQVRELANSTIQVTTMPFGAHVGKDFSEIPASYFKWALGLVPGKEGLTDMDDDMRLSMEAELAKPDRPVDTVTPSPTMDFGKPHHGKPMGDVPIDYLEWIERENPRMSAEVRAGVALELKRRRDGATKAPGAAAAASSPSAAPKAQMSAIASTTFERLRGLVTKGSEEEGRLLATQNTAQPEKALAQYVASFGATLPQDFEWVATRVGDDCGAWMRQQLTPVRAAAPASAPAPAAAAAAPASGPGRRSLFAPRADENEDDAHLMEPDPGEGDGPFEPAVAPRRMRPH